MKQWFQEIIRQHQECDMKAERGLKVSLLQAERASMTWRTHKGLPPPPPAKKALPSSKNISLWVYILRLASLMSRQHPKRWLLAFLPCAGVPVSFEFWLQTCSSQGARFHQSAEQKLLAQWHCRPTEWLNPIPSAQGVLGSSGRQCQAVVLECSYNYPLRKSSSLAKSQ